MDVYGLSMPTGNPEVDFRPLPFAPIRANAVVSFAPAVPTLLAAAGPGERRRPPCPPERFRCRFDVAIRQVGVPERIHTLEWRGMRETAGAGTPFTTAWLAMGVAQVVKEYVPDGGSASVFFSNARGRPSTQNSAPCFHGPGSARGPASFPPACSELSTAPGAHEPRVTETRSEGSSPDEAGGLSPA